MEAEIQGDRRIRAGGSPRQAQALARTAERTGADANPNCAVGAPAVHSRNGEPSAKKLKEVERRDALGK